MKHTSLLVAALVVILQLTGFPLVQIPSVTLTPTPTSTSLPAPAQLRGAPLQTASHYDDFIWYLPPNGQLVAGLTSAEPFPLDPALGIRAIAFAQSPNTSAHELLAATDQGLYIRDRATRRWHQFSPVAALQIESMSDNLWIVPRQAPDQIWYSTNWGETWERQDLGLEGNIVGPLRLSLNLYFQMHTVTLRQGRYVVWERLLSTGWTAGQWLEVATVPGPAVTYTPGGVPGSILVDFPGAQRRIRVGSTDGKIYRLVDTPVTPVPNPEGNWEIAQNFGTGKYPVFLASDLLSVIDLSNGDMRFYRWQGTPNEGIWVAVAFPGPDLPWGASILPNGEVIQRLIAQTNPSQAGFAGMAFSRTGVLYSFEIDPNTTRPTWRLVTAQPQRTHFFVTHRVADYVGPLYSGAALNWNGSNCTADDTRLYRSDNKGLTWTLVTEDTARQLVASWFGNPDLLLAATCAGPSLSFTGGVNWRTPADLGWPLNVGAPFLAMRYTHDAQTGRLARSAWDSLGPLATATSTPVPTPTPTSPPPLSALYAAGLRTNGSAFLYRASFNTQTGAVGPWTEIAPPGLVSPTALFVTDAYLGQEIYLADSNTVWLTTDDGSTWHSRPQGLTGTIVRAVYPNGDEGYRSILAATDRGLYLGPPADQTGPWIPTGLPYTTQPLDFQVMFPWSVNLNGGGYSFSLVYEFFRYVDPATLPTSTPTPTRTSTPTPTVTPTPTPTPTPTHTPPPPCQITGSVARQGRTNHSSTRIVANTTFETTTDAGGRFTLTGLPPGSYRVTASHAGYLFAEANPLQCLSGQSTELPRTTLAGGNANDDNEISLVDLVIVGAAYDTCTGQPHFDRRADLNESGCIDIFDLSLVGINYGRTGPTGWSNNE